uniref:Uncharacterized protein n=1 Tax=Mycena chlorophos TaxID=658473 RepID=A0ABQ0L541_MYCCL|nr:predicted protein [Mycena chlorophos]
MPELAGSRRASARWWSGMKNQPGDVASDSPNERRRPSVVDGPRARSQARVETPESTRRRFKIPFFLASGGSATGRAESGPLGVSGKRRDIHGGCCIPFHIFHIRDVLSVPFSKALNPTHKLLVWTTCIRIHPTIGTNALRCAN